MPISKNNKQYWDVISDTDSNNKVEITHYDALIESIKNIFRVRYGDAGGILRPDWGSLLEPWLHEPMSENVAKAIQMTIIEDVRRNHGFITLDVGSTVVTPLNSNPPGYNIVIGIQQDDYQSLGALEFEIYL